MAPPTTNPALLTTLFNQGPAVFGSSLSAAAVGYSIAELSAAGNAVALLNGALAVQGLSTAELSSEVSQISALLAAQNQDAATERALRDRLFSASQELARVVQGNPQGYERAAARAEKQLPLFLPWEVVRGQVSKLLGADDPQSTDDPFDIACESGDFDRAVEVYRAGLITRERVEFQRATAQQIASSGGQVRETPTLIFTAGAPGAGKSTAINALRAAGYLEDGHLLIDSDMVKENIPEYAALKELNKDQAATIVHPESGLIQLLALERALAQSKNIIVDGTLRATDYFRRLIESIKKRYPQYRISIVFVDAEEATLLERVDSRAKITGRVVPPSVVIDSKQLVRSSVARLRAITDAFFEISNDIAPVIRSVFRDGEDVTVNLTVPLAGGDGTMDYQIRLRAQSLASDASVGTVDQIKGAKRVLRIESGLAEGASTLRRETTGAFNLDEFDSKMLVRLNPNDHWVIARSDDPMAEDILRAAASRGFETIIVGSVDQIIGSAGDVATFQVLTPNKTEFDNVWRELTTKDAENRVMHMGLNFSEEPAKPLEQLADDVVAERTAVIDKLNQSFESRGIEVITTAELDRVFDGRTPVLYSGASKKSWPLVSAQNQREVEAAIRKSLELLDPASVVIVTGGTNYGVEKIVHEMASGMGFTVLGTFVELASIDSQQIGPVTHAVEMGNSWYGKSRPVLKMVAERGGMVMFMGGGDILKNEINMAASLGVDFYLMKGPEGASNDMASVYPERTFVGQDGIASVILKENEKLASPDRRMQAREVVTYEKLLTKARGYNVHVLGGYSGLGYESPQAVREHLKRIMAEDGDGTMYVIGGTIAGIGEAYKWIPEIARELGFVNTMLAGIISSKLKNESIAPQDYLVFVDSPDKGVVVGGESLVVKMANDTGGRMTYFKGGDVSAAEITAALNLGVSVTLIASQDVKPKNEKVVKKQMKDPRFDPDPTRQLLTLRSDDPNLHVIK